MIIIVAIVKEINTNNSIYNNISSKTVIVTVVVIN